MLSVEQIREKAKSIRSMGAATIEAHELEDIADELERLRDNARMGRRRLDALADQMLAGNADGGLLGGRQLKRAVPGIFGVDSE